MDKRAIAAIASGVIIVIVLAAVVLHSGGFIGGDEGPGLIDFDPERAGNDVKALVQNGPRMTGTEGELLGAEYIASQFREAGLSDVHIESFPHMLFDVRSAEVSLVEYGPLMSVPRPLGSTIQFTHIEDFVMQGFSGSYDWNNFRDDLVVVNVGNGTDEDAFSQVQGSAVLVEQTETTPSNTELFRLADSSGARALILQNLLRGDEIGNLPIFKSTEAPDGSGDYPDIPFFMVSKDVGDTIMENSGSHKLRLNIDVWIGEGEVRVVVGDLKGVKDPNRFVVIGAHHDTCYNTIGVVDNTVGTATVIEMARNMAKYKTADTIRFCTFGGEEEGLYGSMAYYDAHRAEFKDNVEVYMNFDMPHADREALHITITTSMNSSIPRMERYRSELLDTESSLAKYKIDIIYESMYWAGSDHWPFTSNGHQAMGGWGSGSAEYHTYEDDLDHLNAESLQICGRIMGTYAIYTAS